MGIFKVLECHTLEIDAERKICALSQILSLVMTLRTAECKSSVPHSGNTNEGEKISYPRPPRLRLEQMGLNLHSNACWLSF